MRASGRFDEPAVYRHRFDVTMTAEDYATNLSTQTAVKALPVAAGRNWSRWSGAALKTTTEC